MGHIDFSCNIRMLMLNICLLKENIYATKDKLQKNLYLTLVWRFF
jgi:hypothetical protein